MFKPVETFKKLFLLYIFYNLSYRIE